MTCHTKPALKSGYLPIGDHTPGTRATDLFGNFQRKVGRHQLYFGCGFVDLYGGVRDLQQQRQTKPAYSGVLASPGNGDGVSMVSMVLMACLCRNGSYRNSSQTQSRNPTKRSSLKFGAIRRLLVRARTRLNHRILLISRYTRHASIIPDARRGENSRLA